MLTRGSFWGARRVVRHAPATFVLTVRRANRYKALPLSKEPRGMQGGRAAMTGASERRRKTTTGRIIPTEFLGTTRGSSSANHADWLQTEDPMAHRSSQTVGK